MLEIPAETHGNIAVLAFNRPPELNLDKLKKRAHHLAERFALDFPRMLADAKARNAHNGKAFQLKAA